MSLLAYWSNGYDWNRKEMELDQCPQSICELDGAAIHFFHIRSPHKGAPPLLLTHGWPDSFLRYAKVFPLLPELDLVVPSLPGFAFSTLPPKGLLNNAEVAELWHRLMTGVLGYKAYAASGGDIGRDVTCYLAARYPQEAKGIHLTDVGLAKELITAPDDGLTPAGLSYTRRALEWTRMEGAYIDIHSTMPQALAYSLSDSPGGDGRLDHRGISRLERLAAADEGPLHPCFRVLTDVAGNGRILDQADRGNLLQSFDIWGII